MSYKSITILATAALGLFAGSAQAVTNAFANGSFEDAAVVAGQFAQGWRGVNGVPGNRTTDEARTGLYSGVLRVADPGLNGSGLVQNSVDDGGLLPLHSSNWGTSPTLTFWAKGDVSRTGSVNFSLRYLDGIGNILNPVVNTSFGAHINASGWTLITLNGPAIPANTLAVFLEMTLAVGPTGLQIPPETHCGPGATICDFGQARVFIDDINLSITAIPEPGTYALMLLGLAGLGAVVRRRAAG